MQILISNLLLGQPILAAPILLLWTELSFPLERVPSSVPRACGLLKAGDSISQFEWGTCHRLGQSIYLPAHDLGDWFKDKHMTQLGLMEVMFMNCAAATEEKKILFGFMSNIWLLSCKRPSCHQGGGGLPGSDADMKEGRAERTTERDQVETTYKHLDSFVPDLQLWPRD